MYRLSSHRAILWLPAYFLAVCPTSFAKAEETVDFARDVLPILSDRCYACHGPDSAARATDLRLSSQESTYELAVVPGDAEASELIRRIYADDDEQMPPPDSNLSLDDEDRALLRRWVDQGAEFSSHWAFVAPTRPALPALQLADWPRGELDYLILDRLRREQLEPSQEADRETLIRRVSLDLTGLPPSLDMLERVLAEWDREGEVAYERLVDRLLASPHFGERMATDWLDVARYADTYGYQNDRYRAMWPWRDWVIQAFNENLSYSDFITWQLAGDLLPQATRDQIMATAFNRHHRQTNEGGSVEVEFRAEYVADRVNTFGAAFLGLTLECSRCHDHKYDPISQREYYQFAAFFNSIDESGLYSHFTEATPTPTLLLPSDEAEDALRSIQAAIAVQEEALKAFDVKEEAFLRWRNSLGDVRPLEASDGALSVRQRSLRAELEDSLKAGLIGDFSFDAIEGDKVLDRASDQWAGSLSESPTAVDGRVGAGLLLNGENGVAVKPGGNFTRDQPFTISLWLRTTENHERVVVLHRSRAWTDSGSRGYELLIEDGKLSAALIHFWPGNAIRIRSTRAIPVGSWQHITWRYDGSSAASGLSLYMNGRPLEVDVVRDNLSKHIHGADGFSGGDASELTIGYRFRDRGFKDGAVDELKVYDRELTEMEVSYEFLRQAWPTNIAEWLHNVDGEQLQVFFRSQQVAYRDQIAGLRELRERRSEVGDPIAEIMVMREMSPPRPTFVLLRGAYDAPGDEVQRGFPESVLPLATEAGLDRLDLARWLVHPSHPLTARVAVNRFWQSLFGRGLVPTAEDFGLQGEAPSHPELLDWLSVEFRDSGWDVKRLIRTVVLSATYRQNSDPTTELLSRDPENRWLGRGPAVRLAGEFLRDGALSASGLLVDHLGGPPVKPYQPPGLWEEKSGQSYQRDEGAGSRRRSLYTFWKRTSPPPAMMTLDASNREVCVVRRQVTHTPLQILVMLNDPQYVEAARALAAQAIESHDRIEEQLQFVFRSLTSRGADQQELAVLARMRAEQLDYFGNHPQAAVHLLAVGDHQADPESATAELAALSAVAGGLMTHHETVMKR